MTHKSADCLPHRSTFSELTQCYAPDTLYPTPSNLQGRLYTHWWKFLIYKHEKLKKSSIVVVHWIYITGEQGMWEHKFIAFSADTPCSRVSEFKQRNERRRCLFFKRENKCSNDLGWLKLENDLLFDHLALLSLLNLFDYQLFDIQMLRSAFVASFIRDFVTFQSHLIFSTGMHVKPRKAKIIDFSLPPNQCIC